MIYANDLWIQLPVKDLYDSLIMLASIQAARDLYKDRRDDLKDFYSKYGDFVTPIAADQEYWANNIVGPTTNVINDMYKLGIDPLRSQEGAMILSQLRNKINNADVARLKTRANNAIDWYKAMGQLRQKGLYNEDFSRFLNETPDQWAANSMGYGSPTAYDDLNAHTEHWFDNVNRNGYIGTDEEGYDIKGVRKEDLYAAMDSLIPDFVNTDYGRYQLELAKRLLGPNASQDDIMDRLKLNIVSAHKELTLNPTRELNPIQEMKIKAQLDDAKDAAKQEREYQYWKKLWDYLISHPKPSSKSGKLTQDDIDGTYDSARGMFYQGIIHSGGADHIEDPNDAVIAGRDGIIDNQIKIVNNAHAMKNMSWAEKLRYILGQLEISQSPLNAARYLGIDAVDKGTGAFTITSSIRDNTYSEDYLSNHLYGQKDSGRHKAQGNDVDEGEVAVPTTGVHTLFFKDTDGLHKLAQFWRVDVYGADDEGKPDYSGGKTTRYVKMPNSADATSNMPDIKVYSTYKWAKKNKKKLKNYKEGMFTINTTQRYKDKGLANTGSLTVNKSISTPSNMGFYGTYNEEAMTGGEATTENK